MTTTGHTTPTKHAGSRSKLPWALSTVLHVVLLSLATLFTSNELTEEELVPDRTVQLDLRASAAKPPPPFELVVREAREVPRSRPLDDELVPLVQTPPLEIEELLEGSVTLEAPAPLAPRPEASDFLPNAASDASARMAKRPSKQGPPSNSPSGTLGAGEGGGGAATSGGTASSGMGSALAGGAPSAPPAVEERGSGALLDHEARLIDGPPPVYPALSRRWREEGRILCRISVSAEGKVTAVEIVNSSGYDRLDEAARSALGTWRYDPAVRGGRRVSSTVEQLVSFQLR